MQGIEPDDIGAELGRHLHEPPEVAEIADPPVPRRSQRVELEREAPHAAAAQERARQVALHGRDDEIGQTCAPGIAARRELQAMIPVGGRFPEHPAPVVEPQPTRLAVLHLRHLRRNGPPFEDRAVLQRQSPVERHGRLSALDRDIDRDRSAGRFSHDDRRREHRVAFLFPERLEGGSRRFDAEGAA